MPRLGSAIAGAVALRRSQHTERRRARQSAKTPAWTRARRRGAPPLAGTEPRARGGQRPRLTAPLANARHAPNSADRLPEGKVFGTAVYSERIAGDSPFFFRTSLRSRAPALGEDSPGTGGRRGPGLRRARPHLVSARAGIRRRAFPVCCGFCDSAGALSKMSSTNARLEGSKSLYAVLEVERSASKVSCGRR